MQHQVAVLPLWLVTSACVDTTACHLSWKESSRRYLKKAKIHSEAGVSICSGQTCSYYMHPAMQTAPAIIYHWQVCVNCRMQRRCELACSARLWYATMLTETSNSSVSAPQRDSPDVKAANKDRQTIISTVSPLSCCCTENVACMCKQITPEKLPNKQFKAVILRLRRNTRGPTADWTAICWALMVFDFQEAGGKCV